MYFEYALQTETLTPVHVRGLWCLVYPLRHSIRELSGLLTPRETNLYEIIPTCFPTRRYSCPLLHTMSPRFLERLHPGNTFSETIFDFRTSKWLDNGAPGSPVPTLFDKSNGRGSAGDLHRCFYGTLRCKQGVTAQATAAETRWPHLSPWATATGTV